MLPLVDAPAGVVTHGPPIPLATPAGRTLVRIAPAATAADLGLALGLGPRLLVDGVAWPPDTVLAGQLAAGATVVADDGRGRGAAGALRPGEAVGPNGRDDVPPVAVLRWVAGPAAGAVTPLGPGATLEAAPAAPAPAALAVPSSACVAHRLERRRPVGPPYRALVMAAEQVTVQALTAEPVLVDGRPADPALPLRPGSLLQLGGHLAELASPPAPRPTTPLTPLGLDGRRPFARPPRRYPAPGATGCEPVAADGNPVLPLDPPTVPAAPSPPSGMGAITALVSAATGVVVGLAVHQPALALFGAVGAAAGCAGWVAQQLRHGRQRQRWRRDLEGAVARWAAHVEGARERAEREARSHPDLVDAVAWARAGERRLWERRTGDADAWRAVLGVADLVWVPPVSRTGGGSGEAERRLDAVTAAPHCLRQARVRVRVAPGDVVGVAGRDASAAALARSLVVQLAVAHGPADLRVAVLGGTPAGDGWAWTSWLPHATDPDEMLTAAGPGADAGEPAGLLVVPDAAALDPVVARAALSSNRVAVVVMAPSAEQLPAACTTVVVLDGPVAHVHPRPVTGAGGVAWAGCTDQLAGEAARALARHRDPEATAASALTEGLDARDLEPAAFDADGLSTAWASLGPDPRPVATLGWTPVGPLVVDLERDGPHALVVGTTGAGKSELLRTLVAGLVARQRPTDCAFVLIDYKGGSAFDACARLPHVAGVVTDLDEQLAARALRSLRAEVRRREQRLRDAGAVDLAAYRAAHPDDPLPRLVVVVDEFATLAADLPGFVPALVGIAQRGRSLGIHLVLATQRPGAAVTDDIRANTNLRVALRVQDAAESIDVVGVPDAARLARSHPGRAVVRLGAGDHHVVQTAHVSAPAAARPDALVLLVSSEAASARGGSALDALDALDALGASAGTGAGTALEVLVDAACAATARLGLGRPAPPWLPPLPATLPASSLPAGAVALADDPDTPAQPFLGWHASDGHLLLCGSTGSGTTTALRAVVAALGNGHDGEAHAYVVDLDGGTLHDLETLDHVGAVVGSLDRERQVRLVRMLLAEHERRMSTGTAAASPRLALVVDRLDTWRAVLDEPLTFDTLDALDRLIAEGGATGIAVVASVARPAALAASLLAGFPQRWVFRLSDPNDAVVAGVRPADVPAGPPGRCVVAATGWTAQIGLPDPASAAASIRRFSGESPDRGTSWRRSPLAVGVLPSVVPLVLPAAAARRPWCLPVGVADADLGTAWLPVHDGDHVLVAGPSGSGRTTALRLLAALVRAVCPDAQLLALAGRPSALLDDAVLDAAGPAALAAVTALAPAAAAVPAVPHQPAALPTVAPPATTPAPAVPERPTVVLVDDADWLDEPVLAALLARPRSGLHVIAAARPDTLRGLHGHWLHTVRRSRLGLLLQPSLDLDGDLLGVALPRRQLVAAMPGRGYLVAGGRAALVHLAQPGAPEAAPTAAHPAPAAPSRPAVP